VSAWRLIDAVVDRGAPIRPTRVEIDLRALAANARVLRDVAKVNVFGVVKADAYGHGAVPVARALWAGGDVAGLAVSLVEEGCQLRDAGVDAPLLVMGPALDGGYDELVGRGMVAMVSDPADLERLAAIGGRRSRPVGVHLKVDTGMGRLGVAPAALGPLLDRARALGGVEITGISTHFACADTDDPAAPESMTRAQLLRFRDIVDRARAAGARPRTLHAANSSATLRFPEARFDLVRPGLAMYGNGHQPEGGAGTLEQVVSLVTRIVQLRGAPAGSTVSYGASWRAERESRLAVLPIGYADGYPRRLSNRAEVLVGGRRCPVVGAVSMDITMVDVTALGDAVGVGDDVVLLGAQGAERITTAELAAHAGLVEYEVTCGISKRVPRFYR
jgi:alanine racemase